MKHKRRRLDEAISNIWTLKTVNGEVGPEFPLIFQSMSQAPSNPAAKNRRGAGARWSTVDDDSR